MCCEAHKRDRHCQGQATNPKVVVIVITTCMVGIIAISSIVRKKCLEKVSCRTQTQMEQATWVPPSETGSHFHDRVLYHKASLVRKTRGVRECPALTLR